MTRQHKCYLDRFEGNQAVILFDGAETSIPKEMLPVKAVEGDHLVITIDIDREARESTSREISDLRESMNSDDGD